MQLRGLIHALHHGCMTSTRTACSRLTSSVHGALSTLQHATGILRFQSVVLPPMKRRITVAWSRLSRPLRWFLSKLLKVDPHLILAVGKESLGLRMQSPIRHYLGRMAPHSRTSVPHRHPALILQRRRSGMMTRYLDQIMTR
jgi:hypothetical protein